jgi:PAS domain-containing protein
MLLFTVRQGRKTVWRFAMQSAGLQLTNEHIQRDVSERTAELVRSREQYRLIAETTRAIPFELDLAHGSFSYIGPQAVDILGFPRAAGRSPASSTRCCRANAKRARAASSTSPCPERSKPCARW